MRCELNGNRRRYGVENSSKNKNQYLPRGKEYIKINLFWKLFREIQQRLHV